jgi:murein DD-endopeptidase MepM/ murein hydrolase activator NlpD
MQRNWFIVIVCVLLCSTPVILAQNTTPAKPLGLPVAAPPGPSTWLLGQPYGNTTGAYNFGQAWYRAGQGLHFGLDLSMPCGTELVAVADGEVLFVDDLGFGSAPHNLLIRHSDLGIVTLYGHLQMRSPLQPGQWVQKGQFVGYSGDPDLTCYSRPHLHLEVRSLDYRTWYNPVDYIDAPWHMLTSVGAFGYPLFQQDMLNPRQWMSIDDQPPVVLGGRVLNDYTNTFPPPRAQQPPVNPPLPRQPASLTEMTSFSLRPLGFAQCCHLPRWHPTDPDLLYVVDGSPGQPASIFEWSVTASAPTQVVSPAPPPLQSPDGTHLIILRDNQVFIRRLADAADWNVLTSGSIPAISTDNSRLLWEVRGQAVIPGQPAANTEFWVSDLYGQNARRVLAQRGGSAQWLDNQRLLITTPAPQGRETQLSVLDTEDGTQFMLGAWEWLRGLDVAPGGGRLLFYLTRHSDPAVNGVYTIETRPDATPQRLSWFGAWRWRDSDSLYYLPFDPTTDQQQLMWYDLRTGQQRNLTTQPFTIANGDWSVSPDGRRIVFYNALDRSMWLLEENGG